MPNPYTFFGELIGKHVHIVTTINEQTGHLKDATERGIVIQDGVHTRYIFLHAVVSIEEVLPPSPGQP